MLAYVRLINGISHICFRGLAINTAAGWELTKAGKDHLGELGFTTISPPSRQQILDAVDKLSRLGHASFDRMLLVFGIDELNAGRDIGSLASRSNALAKFALANPAAKTVEGVSIGHAIVDYARDQDRTEMDDQRKGFELDSVSESAELGEQKNTSKTEMPETTRALDSVSSNSDMKVHSNKVFLVHGRNSGAMHEVARFLEKIGIEVTILHERPNKGRTLISKFEQESAEISYAVVLMIPDDIGGLKGEKPSDRARQNVVFELGLFIGRLGASNVCALVSRGVERPSDFEAVVYVEFDGGKWKTELARELRAAGIPFDHSKVF